MYIWLATIVWLEIYKQSKFTSHCKRLKFILAAGLLNSYDWKFLLITSLISYLLCHIITPYEYVASKTIFLDRSMPWNIVYNYMSGASLATCD